MEINHVIAFSFLAVIVISSGVVPEALAQSNGDDEDDKNLKLERQVLPTASFDLVTDRPLYANGQTVSVTGTVPNFADLDLKNSVTFKVMHLLESTDSADAVLTILALGQAMPSSDGSFTFSFKAGGPLWKVDDAYHVVAYYGGISRDVAKFDFTGANTNLFDDRVSAPDEDADVGSSPSTDPSPTTPLETDPPPTVDDDIVDTPPPPPPPPTPPPPPPPPPPIDDTPPPTTDPVCGPGTELVNGVCQVVEPETPAPPPTPPADDNTGSSGGCLIATAAYGTELAPQVQFLREVRDNTLLSTGSGTSFMTGFNQVYYSFSPTVADFERDSPVFRDVVRTAITPMISTLSIMTLAEPGSEAQVLGLGISVIILNLAIYIAAPTLVGIGTHKYIKSRRNPNT